MTSCIFHVAFRRALVLKNEDLPAGRHSDSHRRRGRSSVALPASGHRAGPVWRSASAPQPLAAVRRLLHRPTDERRRFDALWRRSRLDHADQHDGRSRMTSMNNIYIAPSCQEHQAILFVQLSEWFFSVLDIICVIIMLIEITIESR